MGLLIPKEVLHLVPHPCIDIISWYLLTGKSFFSGSLWTHICHTDASLEDVICQLLIFGDSYLALSTDMLATYQACDGILTLM